jgi:type I restriction enzyme, S subunit
MKAEWQRKTLGEVCVVEKRQGIHKQLPYVGLEHIESKTGRFIGSTEPLGVKSSTFKFTAEHILYGRLRPYLNKVLAPDFVGHCSTEIFPIKPSPQVSREFLQYWFIRDETVTKIDATCTGARMPRASIDAVLSFEFMLPPLPEQQRIVGILDEAFDGIATAKANAEQNRQNARALFESHLQSVFKQRGEGWEEKNMGDVCEVKDGTHDSPKYVVDGIPFVTQKNIREDGLSFVNTKFISQEDHEKFYKRSNVAFGDILISMIGANRGMSCIVDDDRVFSIKNVGLVKRNDSINPHFLLYFLKSSRAADYVRSGSKGGAQEFIGLTELRRFPLILPALSRQNTLVAELDALSAETQRLESIYQQKLAALDELKKSLLHQAFTGQL